MNILDHALTGKGFFFSFFLPIGNIKPMYIWVYNVDFLIYYYSSTTVT